MAVASTDELIAELLECGAILLGNFKLKSGEDSPVFIDVARICHSKALHIVANSLAVFIANHLPKAKALFGPAYKGIVLGTATSMAYAHAYHPHLPVFFDRKEEKKHGDGGKYFGGVLEAKKNLNDIVIIDDVITNGATKIDAITELCQDLNATVTAILVVVDRRKDRQKFLTHENATIPVYSLINLEKITEYLKKVSHPFASDLDNYIQKQRSSNEI